MAYTVCHAPLESEVRRHHKSVAIAGGVDTFDFYCSPADKNAQKIKSDSYFLHRDHHGCSLFL